MYPSISIHPYPSIFCSSPLVPGFFSHLATNGQSRHAIDPKRPPSPNDFSICFTSHCSASSKVWAFPFGQTGAKLVISKNLFERYAVLLTNGTLPQKKRGKLVETSNFRLLLLLEKTNNFPRTNTKCHQPQNHPKPLKGKKTPISQSSWTLEPWESMSRKKSSH